MEMNGVIAQQLDRERRDRAKLMTPADRFLAGGELFEDASDITMAGIRNAHPDWTEQCVMEELRRRLALKERMEQTRDREVSL